MNNTEQKITEELKLMSHSIGVISTVNTKNKPESAAVYYICDDALNLFFVTRSGTRKYQNITKNPSVSFVISSEHPPKTIQIEGSATEVVDAQEQLQYFDKLVAKASESNMMPPVSQMVTGEVVFMKISTTWARFGNFEVMKEGDKFVETTLI